MRDQDIVQLFWDRNEDAVSETKKQYEQYCMYIANNVLQNKQDAEECFNDALLSVWKSIPPHKPENLKTYIGKIVHEIAIDRWRTNNRQKRIKTEFALSLDEIEEVIPDNSFDEQIDERELTAEISRYLKSLDEVKRNVFIRRYWYYDSIDDICKRYGFGKSKVLVMLKRTRDGLYLYLKKEGYII